MLRENKIIGCTTEFDEFIANSDEAKLKKVQDAEKMLQDGYNAFVEAVAALGWDDKEDLYELSIDALRERYAICIT